MGHAHRSHLAHLYLALLHIQFAQKRARDDSQSAYLWVVGLSSWGLAPGGAA